MAINKNLILFFYFNIFIFFLVTINLYVPRPKQKKFQPIDNNVKNISSKINLDQNLNNQIKRKISIGDSYFVAIDEEQFFTITPLSIMINQEFNLSYYSKYFPELIIDADEVISVDLNNYGVQKSSINTNNQACLFTLKNPYFLYRNNDYANVYRYYDHKHWLITIKKSVSRIININPRKTTNCLLITTPNPGVFKNNLYNITEVISEYFIYE